VWTVFPLGDYSAAIAVGRGLRSDTGIVNFAVGATHSHEVIHRCDNPFAQGGQSLGASTTCASEEDGAPDIAFNAFDRVGECGRVHPEVRSGVRYRVVLR
jgi:hypothetical protein